MATLAERLPKNAAGAYYVDSSCIDCDQCRALVPAVFARDADTGFSYIARQPSGPEETALVEEALAACATGSIGCDGG